MPLLRTGESRRYIIAEQRNLARKDVIRRRSPIAQQRRDAEVELIMRAETSVGCLAAGKLPHSTEGEETGEKRLAGDAISLSSTRFRVQRYPARTGSTSAKSSPRAFIPPISNLLIGVDSTMSVIWSASPPIPNYMVRPGRVPTALLAVLSHAIVARLRQRKLSHHSLSPVRPNEPYNQRNTIQMNA
jgi:hypothetical protein